MSSEIKIIALYLPQFHPTLENNEWWGNGFTEWTNVGKAKKLFFNHYQPRVPADLGYYDLRLNESREAQADLAKQYGVNGFCYYHYWFGDGKRLLNLPFDEVLNKRKPDFPFMLCWANESWHKKFWNYEGANSKTVLIEQSYGDKEEISKHFYSLLEAFSDDRYILIDGKPAFMIYKPLEIPNLQEMLFIWNDLAVKNGLNGIHFIAYAMNPKEENEILLKSGFDAVNANRILETRLFLEPKNKAIRFFYRTLRYFLRKPLILNYNKAIEILTEETDVDTRIYPSIVPNWDHTPRSGHKGFLYHNSNPELFKLHLQKVFNVLLRKPQDKRICFIKSWNEWGEGNYMEPDLRFGLKYLETLKEMRENADSSKLNSD
jgi:hypothetical protein